MAYYHATDKKLPHRFIVVNNTSRATAITMATDYELAEFEGGLFVSDYADAVVPYGKYIYRITSGYKPLMIDNGKYVYPVGTPVSAILIS